METTRGIPYKELLFFGLLAIVTHCLDDPPEQNFHKAVTSTKFKVNNTKIAVKVGPRKVKRDTIKVASRNTVGKKVEETDTSFQSVKKREAGESEEESDSPSWGPWQSWGECDGVCGEGHRVRTRICENPTDDADCEGQSVEQQVCVDTEKCEDNDEAVNKPSGSIAPKAKKGEWSPCSVTCGDGTKVRKVTVLGVTKQEKKVCVQNSCDPAEQESAETADEGRAGKLHCSLADEISADVIQWYNPEGKEVRNGKRYNIGGGFLYVVHSNKQDQGTYHCVIKGADGKHYTADSSLLVRTCNDGSACGDHGDCIEMGHNATNAFDRFICKCHFGFTGEFCQDIVLGQEDIWKRITIVLAILVFLAYLSACFLGYKKADTKKNSPKKKKRKHEVRKADSQSTAPVSDVQSQALSQASEYETAVPEADLNKSQNSNFDRNNSASPRAYLLPKLKKRCKSLPEKQKWKIFSQVLTFFTFLKNLCLSVQCSMFRRKNKKKKNGSKSSSQTYDDTETENDSETDYTKNYRNNRERFGTNVPLRHPTNADMTSRDGYNYRSQPASPIKTMDTASGDHYYTKQSISHQKDVLRGKPHSLLIQGGDRFTYEKVPLDGSTPRNLDRGSSPQIAPMSAVLQISPDSPDYFQSNVTKRPLSSRFSSFKTREYWKADLKSVHSSTESIDDYLGKRPLSSRFSAMKSQLSVKFSPSTCTADSSHPGIFDSNMMKRPLSSRFSSVKNQDQYSNTNFNSKCASSHSSGSTEARIGESLTKAPQLSPSSSDYIPHKQHEVNKNVDGELASNSCVSMPEICTSEHLMGQPEAKNENTYANEELQEPNEKQVQEWAEDLAMHGIVINEHDPSTNDDSSVELSLHMYDETRIDSPDEQNSNNEILNLTCEMNESNTSRNNSSLWLLDQSIADSAPLHPSLVFNNERGLSTVLEVDENLAESATESGKRRMVDNSDDSSNLSFCASDSSIDLLLQQIAEETGQATESNVPNLQQELMQFSDDNSLGGSSKDIASILKTFDFSVNKNNNSNNIDSFVGRQVNDPDSSRDLNCGSSHLKPGSNCFRDNSDLSINCNFLKERSCGGMSLKSTQSKYQKGKNGLCEESKLVYLYSQNCGELSHKNPVYKSESRCSQKTSTPKKN